MADDTYNQVVYMGKPKPGGLPGLETGVLKTTQPDLYRLLEALMESSKATAAQAREILVSIDNRKTIPTPAGREMGQISSVRRQARELKKMAESLNDDSEAYIKAYIVSLARPGSPEEKMLSHFTRDVRDIIQHVLDSSCDDADVLREVLELCYEECLNGRLHPDNYFIPLSEACLVTPYDPHFESEAYYDHEDRFLNDEAYSEAYGARSPRRLDSQRKEQEKTAEQWVRFWVEALNKCYGGPTLFYPPASRHPGCQLADVPRYLFRAFDIESSCTLNGGIVASMETKYPHAGSWRDRIDLLSLQDDEAASMLFKHLRNIDFRAEESDNLVSWSSSLLFTIQCAIWRCYGRRPCKDRWQTPYEVKICAVDTTKFPRGQFAHSKSLLHAYRGIAKRDKEMESFFNHRLGNDDYDNGEYLSQGALHHGGRSCVMSLSQLIQAGLYNLYPEFDDAVARKTCSGHVRELRNNIWSSEYTTRRLEMQQALKIAQKCFKNFEASDLALVLLLFKIRKLRKRISQDLHDYRPAEVKRYMDVLHSMPPSPRKGKFQNSRHDQLPPEHILEDLLEIS
ncbi:unnamed protein product [Clonostachys chloroleuca]|uniref:DUF7587 domain-containing protein n=1 Tax=Clonostachys chloroleuca TaxID=1926264 RepID=A0AA35LQP2_9HYPO|nr:unnamed protein product [Clonostachys chloroleuca]